MAYSQKEIEDTFNYICKEIEKGRSLRSVLREDNMPSSSTFFNWFKDDEPKTKQYAYAVEQRAEMIFEDILAIADKSDEDVIIDENGIPQTNHDVIRDLLTAKEIDASTYNVLAQTLKWKMAKFYPKVFGDRTDITSGGEKIQNPSVISVEIVKNEDTSDTSISE